MREELTEGVHLSVVPSKQFKTTRIEIHFLAPLAAETISKRTLLTSLLETSSQAYSTQAAIAAKLEDLYGADFGIGVTKVGQVHRVTAAMTVLADRYAATPLLHDTFQFLGEVLNRPLLNHGLFDEATFLREQKNLGHYIASLAEDRQTDAELKTQQLYFNQGFAQAVPSFGTASGLAAVNLPDLTTTYQTMMAHDSIEVLVLGDVDPQAVRYYVNDLGFSARRPPALAWQYDQPVVDQVKNSIEHAPVQQAKLNFVYHVPTDRYGRKWYANIVAEALFGGSPLSLLFANVREKASLAYYADSMLDQRRHFMVVQTGIDGQNQQWVTELVGQQLEALRIGDFTAARLQAIKDGLLSSRKTNIDSAQMLMRTEFLHNLDAQEAASYQDFAARIEQVSAKDVQLAAQGMKLQATYLLAGEEHA